MLKRIIVLVVVLHSSLSSSSCSPQSSSNICFTGCTANWGEKEAALSTCLPLLHQGAFLLFTFSYFHFFFHSFHFFLLLSEMSTFHFHCFSYTMWLPINPFSFSALFSFPFPYLLFLFRSFWSASTETTNLLDIPKSLNLLKLKSHICYKSIQYPWTSLWENCTNIGILSIVEPYMIPLTPKIKWWGIVSTMQCTST